MTDASLVESLESGNDGHKERTRNVPVKTSAAALDVFLKGNVVLAVLDHVGGVVFLKNIVDVHQRRKLAQIGNYAVVVDKVVLELIVNQTVFVVDANLGLTLGSAEKSDGEKLRDDRDVARLLVVAEITGALTVGVDSCAYYVSVREHRSVRKERCLLFFRIIKAALGTEASVADFLHTSHAQCHTSIHSILLKLHNPNISIIPT